MKRFIQCEHRGEKVQTWRSASRVLFALRNFKAETAQPIPPDRQRHDADAHRNRGYVQPSDDS